MEGAGLAARAQAWDTRAAYHKKRISHHRREAGMCREYQKQIEAQCRALGIEIIYIRGGETHGEITARPHDTN